MNHARTERRGRKGWLVVAALAAASLPAVGGAKAPAGRYQVSSGGGVVTDTWTKLQWQRSVVAGKKTWQGAKDYCAGLDLEGKGWRLPWVRELHGLVDVQEVNPPAIDKTAFPNTPSDWFWSASARAGSSSDAWLVLFLNGRVNDYGVSDTAEVRCVRGS